MIQRDTGGSHANTRDRAENAEEKASGANVICILLLSIRMRCEPGESNDGMRDEACQTKSGDKPFDIETTHVKWFDANNFNSIEPSKVTALTQEQLNNSSMVFV